MDVTELKAKIKSSNLPNFLIFTGDEWAVQKIYIQQIGRRDMEIRRIDSIADIVSKLKNKSLLSTHKILYTVRDDKELMSNSKWWGKIEKLLGDNMLILLVTKPDKRTKFYTQYKDAFIEFKPLNETNLKKYIQSKIQLSNKNCDQLIEVCEGNYGRILLEIDKIQNFGKASNYNDIFENLLKDGTIYRPPKDAIFDFVDAILDRKEQKVFELYEDCKGVGEGTLPLLSVLFNNAKAVLQVQACESKDIAKTTGLTGWQIMNAKKHLRKYSEEELEELLQLITKCEQGIKTGEIEEQFVIEYILVNTL